MPLNTVQAVFAIPDFIQAGLQKGQFERVGGVIRNTTDKQVVAWLKEIAGTDPSAGRQFLPGLDLSNVTSVLNLGVSVAGFSLVLHKLNHIESSLGKINTDVKRVQQTLDLSNYANLKAAVQLAQLAAEAGKPSIKHSMNLDAINKLLHAGNVYRPLVEEALERQSKISKDYISTLVLIYLAETHCHLELEEMQMALVRLHETHKIIRSVSERYVEMMLTSHPSAYLHPKNKSKISFKDFVSLHQWLMPESDACHVFDQIQSEYFYFRKNKGDWVKSLPQAIVHRKEVHGSIWGNDVETYDTAMRRLPAAFADMQSVVETEQRFWAYQMEVGAMSHYKIRPSDWNSLMPSESRAQTHQSLVCILPTELITELEPA